MKYKYIFFDLDGTLWIPEKALPKSAVCTFQNGD